MDLFVSTEPLRVPLPPLLDCSRHRSLDQSEMSRAPFQSPLPASPSAPVFKDAFSLPPPSSPLARQTGEPPGAPKKPAAELENNGWGPAPGYDGNLPANEERYWHERADRANIFSSPPSMAIFFDKEYKQNHQCKHCQRFYCEKDLYRADDVGNTCICCLVAIAYPNEEQQAELVRQSNGDMLKVLADIATARACLDDHDWKNPREYDDDDGDSLDYELEEGELPCGCLDVCRGRCGDYAGAWSFNRGY